MFNLYRFCQIFQAIFALFFIVCYLASPLHANENQSYLLKLKQKIPHYFDDPHRGILDKQLNQDAHQLWQEVKQQGFAIRANQPDKNIRPLFGQIQAHLEQEMLDLLPAPDPAIWIIHTPLIATPLVTQGELSPDLIANDILIDKDDTRRRTALSRATLMREFLKKGGILIIAHANPSDKIGRTKAQMAIFEELKRAYPAQLIELVIDPKYLDKGYPADKIGATYLMQQPNGNVIEITTLGVQINASTPNETWGVWLQERHAPNAVVTKRLEYIIDFLMQSGLQETLENHAKQHGIALEKTMSLFSCYRAGKPLVNDQG